jgi:hypothetical protein
MAVSMIIIRPPCPGKYFFHELFGWSDAGTAGKDAVLPGAGETAKAADPPGGGGGDSCKGVGPTDGDPFGNGGEECEGVDPSGGGGRSEGADPSGGGGEECKGVPFGSSRRSFEFDVAATFLTTTGTIASSCSSSICRATGIGTANTRLKMERIRSI